MKFILGKKLGMSQRWRPDGRKVAVTHVQAKPVVVTQVKNQAKDGYAAVQVGSIGSKKIAKAQVGHTKDLGKLNRFKEFIVEDTSKFERGQKFTVTAFEPGDKVKVIGWSKGRGFTGVVKRHHFKGSPKTHGHKDQLRMPGSIGATDAARVFKGTRMAGRHGNRKDTTDNLEIVGVDEATNELLVAGAVPGARNGLVIITGAGDMPEPVKVAATPEAKTEDKKEPEDETKERSADKPREELKPETENKPEADNG